jgi:hypothetical protein
MVRVQGRNNWRVVIKTYITSGKTPGSSVLAVKNDMIASDAFDYAAQAQGYFRFAIQEMRDVSSLTIDVIEGERGIETIEITRD